MYRPVYREMWMTLWRTLYQAVWNTDNSGGFDVNIKKARMITDVLLNTLWHTCSISEWRFTDFLWTPLGERDGWWGRITTPVYWLGLAVMALTEIVYQRRFSKFSCSQWETLSQFWSNMSKSPFHWVFRWNITKMMFSDSCDTWVQRSSAHVRRVTTL